MAQTSPKPISSTWLINIGAFVVSFAYGCTGIISDVQPAGSTSGSGGAPTGGVGSGGADTPGGVATGGADSGGTGPGGAGSSVGTGGGGATTPPPDPLGSPTPTINYALLRLTNAQYLNTVHDLFPTLSYDALVLPNENIVDRFRNAASGQTPTSQLIENYQTAASTLATAMTGNFAAVVSCQATTTTAEDKCAQSFIADLGKRAYRRPLTTDESSRVFAFYKNERAADTFQIALTSVAQYFLQSPAFLYRLEQGTGQATAGSVPLTSYEIATRLSYFLFDTMPDATLLAAADQNQLTTPAQIEAQARRMLADPRARSTAASFNYQWLGFSRTENMSKDAKAFPKFTSTVGTALHDSLVRFADHVFWEEDSLQALLTDSHAFVSNDDASFYGVASPGSSTLQMVTANTAQRAGILTQPGLLAGLANTVDDSPVKRGLLVLQSFLCRTPQPPPPGVNTTPPAFDPSAPSTVRQRLTTRHAIGTCAGCHAAMDDVGFAFENYDATGMWRTQDSGLNVDASSALTDTDVDGTFTGAIALSQKLAASRDVADCVSYQWLRYALGLNTSQINVAAASSVADAFSTAKGSFKEMLVGVVKSDVFRSLKVSN